MPPPTCGVLSIHLQATASGRDRRWDVGRVGACRAGMPRLRGVHELGGGRPGAELRPGDHGSGDHGRVRGGDAGPGRGVPHLRPPAQPAPGCRCQDAAAGVSLTQRAASLIAAATAAQAPRPAPAPAPAPAPVTSGPPAGRFPDLREEAPHRWWNGQDRTEHTTTTPPRWDRAQRAGRRLHRTGAGCRFLVRDWIVGAGAAGPAVTPNRRRRADRARPAGIEPATGGLEDRCSVR